MATRAHTSFKKRQKELARVEKQKDKAARRMQRKVEKQSGGGEVPEGLEGLEGLEGEPQDEAVTTAESPGSGD